jgi:hypothetical protein
MPRKEKVCDHCLNKGYVSILGWRAGDARQILPCTCRSGRRFERMMRKESPPTKAEPGPVDS